MKRKNNKKSKKLWLKIPLLIIFLAVLGMGGYAYSIYHNAKSTVNKKINEPVDTIDTASTKKKMKATEPLNILLLGVDQRGNDKGRSDALVLLSLDPKKDSMQLVSIPRDTRAMIAGKGIEDKINHAYAYGGADMAVATVEGFLDIDLDYYVRMNMEGLEELVDQLGTIEVDNEVEWDDGKYNFTKGPVALDGDKTMHYVRMRKQDPAGDFGRTERQRKVIEGIIDQGATIGSVNKINGMIDVLGNNMATNMDFNDMKDLLFGYKNVRKNVVSYMMEGSGTNINGIYYYLVPEEEVSKVQGMIAGA